MTTILFVPTVVFVGFVALGMLGITLLIGLIL